MTHEGDAIAAARRRPLMVEVDANLPPARPTGHQYPGGPRNAQSRRGLDPTRDAPTILILHPVRERRS